MEGFLNADLINFVGYAFRSNLAEDVVLGRRGKKISPPPPPSKG
jgi:hypothetical protein